MNKCWYCIKCTVDSFFGWKPGPLPSCFLKSNLPALVSILQLRSSWPAFGGVGWCSLQLKTAAWWSCRFAGLWRGGVGSLSQRILSLKLGNFDGGKQRKWFEGVLYKGGGRGEEDFGRNILRNCKGGRGGGGRLSSSLSLESSLQISIILFVSCNFCLKLENVMNKIRYEWQRSAAEQEKCVKTSWDEVVHLSTISNMFWE